jgi:hypothetical protein
VGIDAMGIVTAATQQLKAAATPPLSTELKREFAECLRTASSRGSACFSLDIGPSEVQRFDLSGKK